MVRAGRAPLLAGSPRALRVTDRRALRISEVAESIGVDHETVRCWVVSGKLRGVRVGEPTP
jgi:excisionase family DNA binding protein